MKIHTLYGLFARTMSNDILGVSHIIVNGTLTHLNIIIQSKIFYFE